MEAGTNDKYLLLFIPCNGQYLRDWWCTETDHPCPALNDEECPIKQELEDE
ncbi:hypothetical protein LCGC14_0383370 [marine sediment metagenome]|uniref:Uncharacterized protein n=1 Tax=marine sediment metagenome TaxID=412755 RepID=A0A0F9WAK9_9ZZZZ